jgi:hypothetical protein
MLRWELLSGFLKLALRYLLTSKKDTVNPASKKKFLGKNKEISFNFQ